MLTTLLIGSLTLVACLAIQLLATVMIIRYLMLLMNRHSGDSGFMTDFRMISAVALVAFIGHLVQAAIWAALFMQLGEFADYPTAFYHSLVNFTSLGYGDIVMSEQWRLLGAMESANGVLMFGITAGALLSIMNLVFRRRHAGKPSPSPSTSGPEDDANADR